MAPKDNSFKLELKQLEDKASPESLMFPFGPGNGMQYEPPHYNHIEVIAAKSAEMMINPRTVVGDKPTHVIRNDMVAFGNTPLGTPPNPTVHTTDKPISHQLPANTTMEPLPPNDPLSALCNPIKVSEKPPTEDWSSRSSDEKTGQPPRRR